MSASFPFTANVTRSTAVFSSFMIIDLTLNFGAYKMGWPLFPDSNFFLNIFREHFLTANEEGLDLPVEWIKSLVAPMFSTHKTHTHFCVVCRAAVSNIQNTNVTQ
jgi:hypothetical protein